MLALARHPSHLQIADFPPQLFGLVWGAVWTHKTILFSAHPLLNSAAVLLAVQAVLVLQPTHTQAQKRAGAHTHAAIWAVSASAFLAGLIVVEVHKKKSNSKYHPCRRVFD